MEEFVCCGFRGRNFYRVGATFRVGGLSTCAITSGYASLASVHSNVTRVRRTVGAYIRSKGRVPSFCISQLTGLRAGGGGLRGQARMRVAIAVHFFVSSSALAVTIERYLFFGLRPAQRGIVGTVHSTILGGKHSVLSFPRT